jgi:two-component system, cell cycle sensor histidine kinase and response regulator CckA
MGEVVYAAPQFGARPGRSNPSVVTAAHVLIVDADPAALAAISQALQSEGHMTATAFDGAGAVAMAERLGPFDLLITDVHMMPMNGVELAETLRKRESQLQVLYVTNTHDELFQRALPLGDEDDVLEKPFSESELIDAVASLLYWHRPRRTP